MTPSPWSSAGAPSTKADNDQQRPTTSNSEQQRPTCGAGTCSCLQSGWQPQCPNGCSMASVTSLTSQKSYFSLLQCFVLCKRKHFHQVRIFAKKDFWPYTPPGTPLGTPPGTLVCQQVCQCVERGVPTPFSGDSWATTSALREKEFPIAVPAG